MKPNFTEEARIWERGVVPAKTLAMLLREMWERGEVAGAGDRAELLAVVKSLRTWREAKRLSWLGRWDGMHPDRLWERVEEAHDAALRETEPAPGGEGTNG